MAMLLSHGIADALPSFLGPPAVRLAELARGFRPPFALHKVRRASLAEHPWLFVTTEESSWALRTGDGLLIPWPSNVQVDTVLCVAKLQSVFAMSSETQNSVLCAWHCWDGRELWCLQTGLKLLQPLYFIDRLDALCAGCFEGVCLWEASTGAPLRRWTTELPVDRIWHFEFESTSQERWPDVICARSTEVLGLTSKLLVWRNVEDVATTEIAWQQCTQEMIMAVACDTSRLYARVGNSLCAWYHESGQERWQRHEPMLPRLPTLPTRLQVLAGKVYVGAGHLIFSLNAETGDLFFKLETIGSVVRLYPISASCNSMVSLIRSSEYALGFLDLSQGALQLTSLRRGEVPKVSITWDTLVILAVIWDACDSDVSALLAWDASTSSLFWERSFENTLQSLCKDDQHIFAGGVGFICALDPSDGSVLWYTEMNGMTKALTLMKLQKKW
eukprot:symbB.v1.2.040910.t1/scaffold7643.1/size10096/1